MQSVFYWNKEGKRITQSVFSSNKEVKIVIQSIFPWNKEVKRKIQRMFPWNKEIERYSVFYWKQRRKKKNTKRVSLKQKKTEQYNGRFCENEGDGIIQSVFLWNKEVEKIIQSVF